MAAKIKQVSSPAVLPDAYVQATYMTDILPHEMQAPGDHLRRGLILVHAKLQLGDEKTALALVKVARDPRFDVPNLGHRAALLHGLTLHRLGDAAAARGCYELAIKEARDRLLEDDRLCDARFTLAVAQAGQGDCKAAEDALGAMKSVLAFRGLHDELVCLASELPGRGGDFIKRVMELQPRALTAEDSNRLMAKLGSTLAQLPDLA